MIEQMVYRQSLYTDDKGAVVSRNTIVEYFVAGRPVAIDASGVSARLRGDDGEVDAEALKLFCQEDLLTQPEGLLYSLIEEKGSLSSSDMVSGQIRTANRMVRFGHIEFNGAAYSIAHR